MSNEQPEALRIAHNLDKWGFNPDAWSPEHIREAAATKLRRQHAELTATARAPQPKEDKMTDADQRPAVVGQVERPVRPASEAFHNPWRTSLENCMTGDNFLRTQEWHDLIEELDDLYRYRCGQHSALQDAYAQGREDERERCSSICQEVAHDYLSDYHLGAHECADLIRGA